MQIQDQMRILKL